MLLEVHYLRSLRILKYPFFLKLLYYRRHLVRIEAFSRKRIIFYTEHFINLIELL